KREKERGGNDVPAPPPPPGSVTGGKRKKRREEGERAPPSQVRPYKAPVQPVSRCHPAQSGFTSAGALHPDRPRLL
ncbi:hypothetical protein KUCAC02_023878, partial [Chaenocephalus aceratus]